MLLVSKGIATRNKNLLVALVLLLVARMLLVAKGIATRSKKVLVDTGIATSSKNATSNKGHRY